MQWRADASRGWSDAAPPDRLALRDRTVHAATLPVGRTGGAFEYRVSGADGVVATGAGRAPPPLGRPARFVVMGDIGDGSAGQRALAREVWRAHGAAPVDFALVAGDLAYQCGRGDEYDRRLFPAFAASDDDERGAPLMREVPLVAAVGNHDVGDLRWPPWPFRCRSDYAFFAFWRHPRSWNAPVPVLAQHAPPRVAGGLWLDQPDPAALLGAANFSLTWGDTHVTVLDSNRYVDWARPELAAWLDRQLEAGRASRWRVVLMHHPLFNRSSHHGSYQWPRALAPIFERHGVTFVFAGHVHNFQWFGPARFTPDAADLARFRGSYRGRLRGDVELQEDSLGAREIDARWPIYVVSGAGNDRLVPNAMVCPKDLTRVSPAGACEAMPDVDGRQASFTLVETGADSLTIRQISTAGQTLLERRIRR